MAHSPQYLGLFQAYIEVTIELRALKTYSTGNRSHRPPSLPSRTNSITPNHPTKPPATVKTTPLPQTTSLPSLKKEDFPDEVMWTLKEWSANERARKNNSEKVSPYDYLRDENSLPPSSDAIGEMRNVFKQACCRVELAGLRPRTWKRCVPEVLKYIHDTMSAVFPVFRYANNNWKVAKFGTRVYFDWNRDYETDSDDDVAPKKRKKSSSNLDSDSDDETGKKKGKLQKTTKPVVRTKMDKGTSKKASPPPPPLPPSDVIIGPSPPNMNAPQPQLVADLPVPPAENQSQAFHTDHEITPSRNDSPPSSDTAIQATDPAPPAATFSNDSGLSDDVPTTNVDPKTHVAAPQRDLRPQCATRATKNKPNPLSGLSIPKPTTEIPHSETAPETRTCGGSKVMEPHPTHLSAKNMFAHEMKKKNPEITQDEFNTLFDRLTTNEKKTYEKMGKARRTELKKLESSATTEA
ncbi:hypothetical protein BJ165DRAFT_1484849 [Panaeolus papilionaceus]|nr:hypothetical protein BJ165DRAFT_1484849 [Panaeolus papilionaceus]